MMKHLLVALCTFLCLAACSADADDAGTLFEDILPNNTDVIGGDGSTCTPDCTNRVCGDDGCGNLCGTCETPGTTCDAGQCVMDTITSCAGLCGVFDVDAPCKCDANCFDNGDCCEDICDVCTESPTIANRCDPPVCVPTCGPKDCGDDGCGGQCGPCDAGTSCVEGTCVEDTQPPIPTSCEGNCGEFFGEGEGLCNCDPGCFQYEDCCEDVCDFCEADYEEQCEVIEPPTCDPPCGEGQVCVNGVCEDEPEAPTSCEGVCGEFFGEGDGFCNCDSACFEFGDCCDDVCDVCAADFVDQCNEVCEPTCEDGQECGDDGCGGTCGEGCAEPDVCNNGVCEAPCTPACEVGQECGDDGCGGTCGDGCAKDMVCGDDGMCSYIGCYGVDADEVCPETTQCGLTAAWDDLLCYPDVGEGEACGSGIGFCPEDWACVWDSGDYLTQTCQPQTGSLGDSCGHSMANCQESVVCTWVLPDEAECTEYVQEGGACGLGEGVCAEDLDCWLDSPTSETSSCYPKKSIGDPCAWGYGSCGEGLWCMWDEVDDVDGVPHCYPATIEEGETCGEGWGGCAPWLDCVDLDETGTESQCMPIGLHGDPCGVGIGECASSVGACVLLTSDSDEAMCMKYRWPGETCGVGIGDCWDTLLCVASIADPEVGVCEDQCIVNDYYDDGICDACWGQDIDCFCIPSCDGKSCGDDGCGGTCGDGCADGETCDEAGQCAAASCAEDWDACPEGTSCLLNATYTDLTCEANDGAEGEPCAYGNGGCAEGFACTEGGQPGTGDYICQPETGEEGDACAFGAALCAEGFNCEWVAFGLTSCVPELALGDDCLAADAGSCPEGSSCMWTSQDENAAICMADDQEDGEPCYWGHGFCVDGSTCNWTDESTTAAECYPDDGALGESCEANGDGGCVSPLVCTLPSADASAGTCLPIAWAGEPCGYGVGYCFNGTSCQFVEDGSDDTVCMEDGWLDDSCGAGIGGCNGNLSCIAEAGGDTGTCQDICEANDWYGDGICDDNCLIFDASDCLPADE